MFDQTGFDQTGFDQTGFDQTGMRPDDSRSVEPPGHHCLVVFS
jgi:hypothetical protein